jgi:hypothetical protein
MAIALLSVIFWLTFGIIRFGRRPGYSHIRHTISELGESGAPAARQVNFGIFLPVGAALLGMGVMLWGGHPDAAGLAACIGAGYAVAAFFPCDPGSPLAGSMRQQIHNAGGAIEYLGGAYFIARLQAEGAAGLNIPGLPALLIASAVALSVPSLSPWRGLIQRLAEIALFLSLFFALH